MTSKRLLEMIDACRPGSDDLSQPELSELADELSRNPQLQNVFDQSQELDLSIRSSFQAVAPPHGLVDRLLESLEKNSPDAEDLEAHPDFDQPLVELSPRKSRRTWTMLVGSASLTAIVAALVIWLQAPSTEWTLSESAIAARVDVWNKSLEDDHWQGVADSTPAGFPTWRHLKLGRHDRWQWLAIDQVVCYDLANGEGTARLFVMKPAAKMALPATPSPGYPSAAGWHVGAWQANGRVYFLAVRTEANSKRLYERIIAPPAHA